MGLSDDQRAMLRLLAQREEGYEDIAALKGMSVEEVRTEVKAALAELDAAPEPPPSPPPEEPPPPAKPVAEAEEKAPAPASRLAGKAAAAQARRPTVPVERRRFLAVAAGALALVAVVIGAIALVGGDSESSSANAESGLAEGVDVDDERVTQAVLTAPEGDDASGRAIFGRLGKEEVVLQVTAEGLEPTPQGESYTVWLYRSPKLALRVGAVKVEADEGELGARFPIPAELLAYIAGGAFQQIYVSRTSDAAYQREVAQAKKQNDLPRYSGETVLAGKIAGPIVEAGQKARRNGNNSGGGGNSGGGR